MVAGLVLVILMLVAYIGSTWATMESKDERIAALEAVLARRGGDWHEVPRQPINVPKVWEVEDEPTRTIECIAPPRCDDDQTERRVMIL